MVAALAQGNLSSEQPGSTTPSTTPSTSSPPSGLSGTISGLAYIEVYVLPKNWDGDAEADGVEVSIYYHNSSNGFVRWDRAVISASVKLYATTGVFSSQKLSETPFLDHDFVLQDSDETIKIPVELYAASIPRTAVSWDYAGDTVIAAFAEVTISVADGGTFSANYTGSVFAGH